MLPIRVNSWLFAFLLPFAAAQVQLPPGLPACASPCGNIIGSPAAASCANLTGGSIHCYCTTPGVITQIAQCGTTLCPPDVVNEMYAKLANICSQVGGALPATITLSSTTLVLPSSTSTSATSNTTSTAAKSAASASSSSTACGMIVQGTGLLEWTLGVMAMYLAA